MNPKQSKGTSTSHDSASGNTTSHSGNGTNGKKNTKNGKQKNGHAEHFDPHNIVYKGKLREKRRVTDDPHKPAYSDPNYKEQSQVQDPESRYIENHEVKGEAHDWDYNRESQEGSEKIKSDLEQRLEQEGREEGTSEDGVDAILERADISKDGTNKEEYARLKKEIEKYLKKGHSKERSVAERFKTFYRTISLMAKNAMDLTLGSLVVKYLNKETMRSLEKGDRVVAYIHGGFQNEGAALELIKQARSDYRMHAYGIKYDWQTSPEVATRQIESQLKAIVDKTGRKVFVAGHSLGGLNLTHGIQNNGWRRYVQMPALLVEGVQGGLSKDTLQQKITHMLATVPFATSPYSERGRENIINYLRKNTEVPTTSIYGTGDMLVQGHMATHPQSSKIIAVDGASHFDFAGANPLTNKIMLDQFANRSGSTNNNAQIDNALHTYKRRIPEQTYRRAT